MAFFGGLLLLLNFWTCFTTERAAFNRDIYPSPKRFSFDFNCFPFSRIAMIWYAKKFDERQENGARKKEKLDLSFEKKKKNMSRRKEDDSLVDVETKWRRLRKTLWGGGVFSVVGFWVQMITALSIVWKTRKRQRLFLTSSWLPADTSVCSHPVTGWPPHHRNNPLIEKRAPRCKLQPSTWPRKTKKKSDHAFNVSIVF